MNIIGINTGSTDTDIEMLKRYLNTLSNKENVVYARIRYSNFASLSPNAHPFEYPLCIYTTDNIVFCLTNVTAGYGGTGPRGMVKVLKYLGFDFDENDIFKHQQIVSLDFLKDGVTLKSDFTDYLIPLHSYLSCPFQLTK